MAKLDLVAAYSLYSELDLGMSMLKESLPPPRLNVSFGESLRSRDLPTRHVCVFAPQLLDRFGLTDLARRQTGALSGGQQRRRDPDGG